MTITLYEYVTTSGKFVWAEFGVFEQRNHTGLTIVNAPVVTPKKQPEFLKG